VRSLLALLLSSVSCLSLADGYGLVSSPVSDSVDSAEAVASTGYGLVPTQYERSAQVSNNTAKRRSELAISKQKASSGYVAPREASRLAPPAVSQPNMASFQSSQKAPQRYVKPIVKSRYSSQERVSNKQYDVGVTGQRGLAQIMRAPAQFASSEPQQLRKLQLGTAKNASLQKLRAQVGVNNNGVTSASKASLGKANLQGLSAKFKSSAKSQPISVSTSNTAKAVNLDQLRAKVQLSNTVSKVAVAPVVSAGSEVPKSSIELSTPLNKIPKAQTEKSLSSANLSKIKKPQVKAAETSNKNLLDSVTQAIGIVDVKPWQKAKLAEQSMKKGGAIPSLAKFSGKVFISKEASRGGQGVAGGGCGCN
jgi:hypothetical protein